MFKRKNHSKDNIRLLTEAEKKAILESYDNMRDKSRVLSALIVIGGIYILMFILFGMREGLVVCAFASVLVIHQLATFGWVAKRVRDNRMYAAEAIYLRESGKYNHVCLKEYKSEYVCKNFLVREPLKKGDRVIVLEMRGQAWIYKARR